MSRALFRYWLTFESPVTRGAYLRHGLGLTALKYTGDVILVGAATGRLWTPIDYLHSIPFLLSTKFAGAPTWLMPALSLWTLPFLWAGITLTMRRALAAGRSAWWSLGFFVPYLNYGLMALLSMMPSSVKPSPPPPLRDRTRLGFPRRCWRLRPESLWDWPCWYSAWQRSSATDSRCSWEPRLPSGR